MLEKEEWEQIRFREEYVAQYDNSTQFDEDDLPEFIGFKTEYQPGDIVSFPKYGCRFPFLSNMINA